MELCYIKNWRPITLLNVDYKIYTHVVKNRILKAIPDIICNVQSGFQSGKCTSDNLVLMSLILEHFNNYEDQEGLLIQVDFEKAFDSVEHNFLYNTMEKLGFGPYLIHLVKVAFFGCLSYVNVNGYLSSPVYLFRGLHQGSPLSPILFLLVAQIFSSKLDKRHDISGLTVQGVDILLSLFADDTDIFLNATRQCVDAVFQELHLFGIYSGCKANLSKTRCIPLGMCKQNTGLLKDLSELYGEEFIQNKFSALGINYNNFDSIEKISNINYLDKLEKAKSWVDVWSKRDLTLMGKVTIIKSLIFSQFTYLAIPLLMPSKNILNKINTLIFNFLWGCKRDKIKRDVITRTKQEGGLDLFIPADFIMSLKITLFNKLFNSRFKHSWKEILVRQLRYPSQLLVSVECGVVSSIHCKYTHDILYCYSEWKARTVSTEYTINHCIWGNQNITGLWNKVLWNEILIDKGIIYISHFLNNSPSKTMLSYEELCRKYHLLHSDITRNDYSNIRIAVKSFINRYSEEEAFSHIDEDSVLSRIIENDRNAKGRQIRTLMSKFVDPDTLSQLREWSRELSVADVDWVSVFNTLHYNTCNNFKLIQFQYKLLMRISTSKYMRFKMGIVKDNPYCSMCTETNNIETLSHIFLKCPHTKSFISRLRLCIQMKIDPQYRDRKNVHFIFCNHTNQIINYINIAAKWYISKQFQKGESLVWEGFKRLIKLALIGERSQIKNSINQTLFLGNT